MIKSFKKFLKGFTYAFSGIAYAVKTQRNLRFHITLMAFMFFFLLRYDFFKISKAGFALLAITCGVVIALELVNTAIETVVDLVSPDYNRLAKIAKDTAAGAVLVSAVAAVAEGLIIMLQPQAFVDLFNFYKANVFELVLVIIAIVITVIWILLPRKEKGSKNNNE